MAASSDPTPPLQVLPFRATTFDPRAVSSLAAVSSPPGRPPLAPLTSPPYDVVGRADAARWRNLDPHNIVRLTLPVLATDGTPNYAGARETLQDWRAQGVLTTDAVDALYAYEIALGPVRTVGVVAAVSLHEPGERRILPHEHVFPAPVADRATLMRTARAQLEPILLTYDGGGANGPGPTRRILQRAISEIPWREVRTEDGATHRLWRIAALEDHAAIAADMAHRQLLIADGHHRYRAYLTERESLPGSDLGLAYVVDDGMHPLQLHAIHRSVCGLDLPTALSRLSNVSGVHTAPFHGDVESFVTEAPAALPDEEPAAHFLISDGTRQHEVTVPWTLVDSEHGARGATSARRHLDAAILHQVVFAQAWDMDDADTQVDFHHDVDAALSTARADRSVGVAVLLRPPRVADVMALAGQGDLMPRKSTSFGPKPRTGLLMRMLED